MSPFELRLSSCLALLLFACTSQESARPAEQPRAAYDSPSSSQSVEEGNDASALTPASGSLAPAEQNSLASTSSGGGAGAAPSSPGVEAPARKPDVIYVPTPQAVVDRMLQMAQVKKGDVVYDLGCGDGRIVVTAAKRYGTRARGFDIDPDRVAEAQANVKAAGVEHLVTIEQQDIFTLDLSPASVVTLYLLPRLNVQLIPQLEKLKPGSRIVSHDFNMEGIKPVQHVALHPPGETDHEIYLWKTPLVRE
jgi:SAM-dependent methyltransferase